jgi:hypothetical protein
MSFEGRPQQNIILFDDAGNPVDVVDDAGTKRLAVDVAGIVSVGPSGDVALSFAQFIVEFTVGADPTNNIVITEIRLVFTAGAINWGHFGKGGGLLTNGVHIDAEINDGTHLDFVTMDRNEDFVRLPSSRGGATFSEFNASGNDMLGASVVMSGINERLIAGTTDFVRVQIRDDLTSAARDIDYFTATLYGYKEV